MLFLLFQVIDIPDREQRPYSLELDPEWLVVLKKTDHLLSVSCAYTYLPGPGSGERYFGYQHNLWSFNLCALQAIAHMICTTKHFQLEAVLESFPGLNAQFPNN